MVVVLIFLSIAVLYFVIQFVSCFIVYVNPENFWKVSCITPVYNKRRDSATDPWFYCPVVVLPTSAMLFECLHSFIDMIFHPSNLGLSRTLELKTVVLL